LFFIGQKEWRDEGSNFRTYTLLRQVNILAFVTSIQSVRIAPRLPMRPTTVPTYRPILAQAPSPTWLSPAEQLRQVLAQLAPQERPKILDYISTPPEPPKRKTYSVAQLRQAAQLVAERAAAHPSRTQAGIRAVVAREMGIATVELRYMLSRAAEL
jgi:hypothetical protein